VSCRSSLLSAGGGGDHYPLVMLLDSDIWHCLSGGKGGILAELLSAVLCTTVVHNSIGSKNVPKIIVKGTAN